MRRLNKKGGGVGPARHRPPENGKRDAGDGGLMPPSPIGPPCVNATARPRQILNMRL